MKTQIDWPLREIVEVEWEDACSEDRWGTKEDYMKRTTLLCRSSGYLLKVTKREVTVVQNLASSGSMADSMTIPRTWVTKIRKLK